MAAAIPGAISLGASLFHRGGGQNKQSTALQNDVMNESIASARQARDQGGSLFSMGAPLLQAAGGYWQKLLNGNRDALIEATAPERLGIERSFQGAEKGLQYGPLRGGARDYAAAELAKEKASQMGGLIPAMRLAAAQQGGGLGLSEAGTGTTATANAGSLFRSIYGGQEVTREFNVGQSEKFGEQLSTLFTNLISGFSGDKKSKTTTNPASSATRIGPIGGPPTMIPGTSIPRASFAGVSF